MVTAMTQGAQLAWRGRGGLGAAHMELLYLEMK